MIRDKKNLKIKNSLKKKRRKHMIKVLIVCLVIFLSLSIALIKIAIKKKVVEPDYISSAIVTPEPISVEQQEKQLKEERDKRILAQLVQAEAGNQPLTGMRFVVDVVLNRVDSPNFPNTIEEVIYQKYQFSVIDDGAFERAKDTISKEAFEAVELEWEERLDYEILYFSSTEEPVNGTKPFKYYGHWFSYKE